MLAIGDDSSPYFEDWAHFLGYAVVGNIEILSRDIIRDYALEYNRVTDYVGVPYSFYKDYKFYDRFYPYPGKDDSTYYHEILALESPPVRHVS